MASDEARSTLPEERSQNGLQRGGEDVRVEADAPLRAVGAHRLDVRHGGGVGAGAEGMLVVVDHV